MHIAYLLPEMCEWNTYMCCWTGNDGPDGMTSNTDVCRVWDYPEEGNSLEFPRDSEGSVYWWVDVVSLGVFAPRLYFFQERGYTSTHR